MDGTGLDSSNEDSSTLDMAMAWRGFVLMMEEVCLSIKFLRNFTHGGTKMVFAEVQEEEGYRQAGHFFPKLFPHISPYLSSRAS